MNTARWPKWVGMACGLALVLGLAAGCSDDDDDADAAADDPAAEATDGTVATNVVETTNGDGSISLITNLVFVPAPIIVVPLKLAAPKLVAPADGVAWALLPGAPGATVKFEWEAVSGADSYSLAVKRAGNSDFTTTAVAASPAWAQHPRGTNFWKVAAVKGGVPQTWSETRSFIFE